MGGKHGQGETMKRRTVVTKRGGAFGHGVALLRGYSWLGAALCVALLALSGFAQHARGQQAAPVPLVPPVVSINAPTVSRDAAVFSTEDLKFRFPGKEPKQETSLEFNGNKKDWSFIQFDTLPPNTSLRTKGTVKGYSDSQIQSDKWYWFKEKLPLILGITSGAQSPVNLSFRFGTLPDNSTEEVKRQSPETMRTFTDSNQGIIIKDPKPTTLELRWDGAGGAGPVSMEPKEVTLEVPLETGNPAWQKVTLTSDPSVWTFVRAKQWPSDFELKVTGSELNLTVPVNSQPKSDEWIGFKGTVNLEISMRPGGLDPQGSRDLLIETAVGQSPDQTKELAKAQIKDNKINGNSQPLKVSWKPMPVDSGLWPGTWPWSKIGIVVAIILAVALVGLLAFILWGFLAGVRQERRLRSSRNQNTTLDELSIKDATPQVRDGTREIDPPRDSSRTAAPAQKSTGVLDSIDIIPESSTENTLASKDEGNQQGRVPPTAYPPGKSPKTSTAPQPSFDRNQVLQAVEDIVAPFRAELDQKAKYRDHFALADDVKAIKGSLQQTDVELKQLLAAKVNETESFVLKQTEAMQAKVERVETKNSQLDQRMTSEGDRVKGELGNTLKELALVEARLKARITELQTALSQQAVPDSFYAKTLGAVLGQNIEDLNERNFDRLIGERLNQFFKTGVARDGEGLQELGGRADRIHLALKAVAEQMTKLNPQATNEAQANMQRAEALATDLKVLQSQLQTRRVTIETILRVPTSNTAGARQTFLDDLGKGIRREIEKLNDPESYFAGELERLITADLIAIVDICDKKVATAPGTRPDLEAALKKLFDEAGLRSIVPKRDEQFKTAEQDLIDMDQGGTSLTVSQVVTRGFYYKHGDSETLLRKAGVRVYR